MVIWQCIDDPLENTFQEDVCLEKSKKKKQNISIKDRANKQKHIYKQYICASDITAQSDKQKGFNLAMFPTMEVNSNRADIKGIICRHLKRPLIQFEKYFSESDNCFCDAKWIQFPFGDRVTEGSRRTVTAKDWLIELSPVSDIRPSYPLAKPPVHVPTHILV